MDIAYRQSSVDVIFVSRDSPAITKLECYERENICRKFLQLSSISTIFIQKFIINQWFIFIGTKFADDF